MSHSRYGRADHGPGQAASTMTSAPRSSSALRSSLTRGSRVCRKILICAVLLILSAAPSNSEEGRPWLPTAPHLHKLSTKAEVGAYQLRVPEGYVLRTQSGPGGSMAHAWVGSPRSDGTRPYVMLTMGAPAPGETNPYTLTQVLAKFLAGIERRRKHWRQSNAEEGTIHGVQFVRAYWHGTDIETGRPMHGFNYVAMDGDKVIQLSSQDVEPSHRGALELAETAVLTFKKR